MRPRLPADFYRQILSENERDGDKIIVIAFRHGVSPNTAWAWLRRARQFRSKGEL